MLETTTRPRFRERFPTLESATYLVSHSMGAPPLGAKDALEAYWQAWAREGPGSVGRLAARNRGARRQPRNDLRRAAGQRFARAQRLAARSGDRVGARFSRSNATKPSSKNSCFPSVTYVWKAWERFGARAICVPSDDGRTMSTDRLCSAITERTAVVALSHAAYVSGALIDVPAIVARCRETGALFVLDAYQTTGVYPYDVRALDLDIVVGGSHKWLCGGPGCGFIYIKPELRSRPRTGDHRLDGARGALRFRAGADSARDEPASLEHGNADRPGIPRGAARGTTRSSRPA